MSVGGGIMLGLSGVASSGCQNCGHGSHCGSPLREEAFKSRGDRLGVIEICKKCRCSNCSKLDDE